MTKSSTIKSLNTREQCREKLPIWFGSRSNYYHGLVEVMANANDEMTNYKPEGNPFKITIVLEDDNQTIYVGDCGRGIPLTEIDGNSGRPIYELLFETLFTGTNFENEESGKETTGTNGCGLTVLNHTCELFEVKSYVGNNIYSVKYENGGTLVEKNKTNAKNTQILYSGTSFRFKLDKEMYTETVYNIEEIKTLCNHLAGISNGLEIELSYNGEWFNYKYDSLMEYIQANCNTTLEGFKFYDFDERIATEGNERDRMHIVWSIGTEPYQESYLNNTYLKENGTIYDGVIDGFRRVIDKYSNAKTKITSADIELGLNFVCGLWTNSVEFANQTKFSTKKQTYKKFYVSYVMDKLEEFKAEHPKEFDMMVNHFTEINNFNKKAEDEIKTLKKKIEKKAQKGLSPKIEGLVDCDMRKSTLDERILIIDEGLSANSTIINARDSRYMGCIGLRGRFINSYKTSIVNVFNNQPAMAVTGALGCGIEIPEGERKRLKGINMFNHDDLRYGKIAIITDADWAGKAIALSLITFFYKFYPTLCKEGRVYVVISPRFVLYDKKNNPYYVYNERERDAKIKELGKDLDHIGIVKGLGELNGDEFWDYVLSPEARKETFIQIDFSKDLDEIERLLEITMGEDVEPRKEYIINNVNYRKQK